MLIMSDLNIKCVLSLRKCLINHENNLISDIFALSIIKLIVRSFIKQFKNDK
jgi:hypothetical protein